MVFENFVGQQLPDYSPPVVSQYFDTCDSTFHF